MKGQWGLIAGLSIVLIIAIFAVINVDPVTVNYGFGEADWPLVLVILGSVLMGGLIVGFVGMFKIHRLQQEIKHLKSGKDPEKGKKEKKNPEDEKSKNPKPHPMEKQ